MDKPRFIRTDGVFTMTCSVGVDIHAEPETVWSLLIDAKGFPRWNSTVTGIEGEIREGGRLKLHVPGTDRTLTPKVSDVVPMGRMTWSDGFNPVFKGVRRFFLEATDARTTRFVMEEHFSGFVFALTKRMLPDFRPIFVAYANDLKREAEGIDHVRTALGGSSGLAS